MNQILILEDEVNVNRGIAFSLKRMGYEVESCFSYIEAINAAENNQYDMVICDINLPDRSGLDFIKWFRSRSDGHIICLTALDLESDFVLGYEAGADDYVTKPFSLSVLSLKIEAYFNKKNNRNNNQKKTATRIKSGDICFLVDEMKLKIEDNEIELTKNEWRLLKLFMENPQKVLSKNQILENAFDINENFVDENTVAVNIRRLRDKLGDSSAESRYIKNIRGLGYIWNEECR